MDESFHYHNSYTRCCEKNGTYSLLDFIFLSRSLKDGVKPSTNVKWSSLSEDDLKSYEAEMAHLLDTIQVPVHTLHGDRNCSSLSHLLEVENYFQSLLEVVFIADSHIPRNPNRGKTGKGFWNDSLTNLKTNSIES